MKIFENFLVSIAFWTNFLIFSLALQHPCCFYWFLPRPCSLIQSPRHSVHSLFLHLGIQSTGIQSTRYIVRKPTHSSRFIVKFQAPLDAKCENYWQIFFAHLYESERKNFRFQWYLCKTCGYHSGQMFQILQIALWRILWSICKKLHNVKWLTFWILWMRVIMSRLPNLYNFYYVVTILIL